MSKVNPTYKLEARARDTFEALQDAELRHQGALRDHCEACEALVGQRVLYRWHHWGREEWAPAKLLRVHGAVAHLLSEYGTRKEAQLGDVQPICPPLVCESCGVELVGEDAGQSLDLCVSCSEDACGACGRPPHEPCICRGVGDCGCPEDVACDCADVDGHLMGVRT